MKLIIYLSAACVCLTSAALAAPPHAAPKAAEKPAGMPLCGPLDKQVSLLIQRRGEFPVFRGEAAPGMTLHVFANPKVGSWTMLRVLGGRIACVEDNGHDARYEVGL